MALGSRETEPTPQIGLLEFRGEKLRGDDSAGAPDIALALRQRWPMHHRYDGASDQVPVVVKLNGITGCILRVYGVFSPEPKPRS